MKKILIYLIGLTLSGTVFAQMPRWVISPDYDKLTVKVDNSLLQADSLGVTSLWTMDGKCLFKTEHFIHPFKDGVAVITKKDKNDIIGFVDASGIFTEISDVQVAYNHPFFENGYLICHDLKGYSYYKTDGLREVFPQSVRSYPFHEGYAPFLTFDQFEKKKDPHYGYLCSDGQKMKYMMLDKGIEKEVDPRSINFLSGISTKNRGVAVIKNKLYYFIPESRLFEPFLYGNDESEKRRHLVLNGDYEKYFLNLPEDTIEIIAKYGKDLLAFLQFDKELRPIRFIFDDAEEIFPQITPKKFEYSSDIQPYKEGVGYGLTYSKKQILPKQFEEVGLMYGNKAFVKQKGKWGLIEIVPNLNYSLKINKGEDVAFRHQKFETQIRLDLPSEISSKEARIDIPALSGCIIDKTSRETKDTESGNFVVYNCSLNIPDSLPDTMTTITYSPVSISYDGIQLFETPIDIKAWHYKYFNVDPIESETSISNGIASFTININAQKNVGESDYPFEVKIEADSVSVQYEKISETRYKCLVSNLQEGNNNLNIFVTEKGCPPSIFPFEVYYTKPVPKKKKQEAVVVRKKSPQVSKPDARIEL